MKVVDHVAGAWTMYVQGQDLFLEAACVRGAFGFSVLLRLDADETHAFGVDGRTYAGQLAAAVRTSMMGSGSPFAARDVATLYSDRVATAMEAWRASTEAATATSIVPGDGALPT
jgi:hypothetical protein